MDLIIHTTLYPSIDSHIAEDQAYQDKHLVHPVQYINGLYTDFLQTFKHDQQNMSKLSVQNKNKNK